MPKRLRTLVVEDNAAYAQVLLVMLGLHDAVDVVGHAASGTEAVDLARQLRPDVVLMDVHLPELDGFEATRRIRAERSAARVVFLTSSSDPDDQRRAREAGAERYLVKGCGEDELVAAITGRRCGADPDPATGRLVFCW